MGRSRPETTARAMKNADLFKFIPKNQVASLGKVNKSDGMDASAYRVRRAVRKPDGL